MGSRASYTSSAAWGGPAGSRPATRHHVVPAWPTGNACSVDAVADLFGVSVGAIIKSTRRVAKALSMIAPEHIKWPSRSCRAASSRFAADGYGFQGCIGATDGTTFPLAYQPALHPWSYFDRNSRYSLNGIITCDWNYNVINVMLGCTGAAPDTFVQSTAHWHQNPAIYFSAGEYLLSDKGMLYTSRVIGPIKEPDCTSPAERNFNYQLARLRLQSEHTIGILKGRWSSLKELRVALATDKLFSFAMGWVVACCVLHDVCVKEGDAFPEEALSDESPESVMQPEFGACVRRREVQERVCAFMRQNGTYRANV